MKRYPYEEIKKWIDIADGSRHMPRGHRITYPLPCAHAGHEPFPACKELLEYGFLDAYGAIVYHSSLEGFNLSPAFIRSLHQMCLLTEKYKPGMYRSDIVAIHFADHVFDLPELIPKQISSLCESLEPLLLEMSPIEAAAHLHRGFVNIHPFYNGNGRVARLLMNFVLLRHGYEPLWINAGMRAEYVEALNSDRDGETSGAFPLFIAKSVAINQTKAKRRQIFEAI